jgi:hypothetical protein
MTARSAGYDPPTWMAQLPCVTYQKILKSAEVLYRNAVAAVNTSGEFVEVVGTDPTLICYGFHDLADADSLTGDGTKEAKVASGCKLLVAGATITQADEGKIAYAVDDQTFSLSSNSGVRPVMGVLRKFVSSTAGYVEINPILSRLLMLESTGFSTLAPVLFSLYDFREVDSSSDVGDTTANGGLLSSNTTPILRGNAAETQEISWATGNVDPIAVQKSLPSDFDGSSDVTVDLWVNSGTTNAATFTVETGWDGAALVSDTADDSSTKSATTHKITATIAAADIPDTASNLTLVLTPATHATDTIQLQGMRVNYKRKLLTV